MPPALALGPRPQLAYCPNCMTIVATTVKFKNSTKTRICACLLCIIGCIPCAAGVYCCHCSNCPRNVKHYCANCNVHLGMYVG